MNEARPTVMNYPACDHERKELRKYVCSNQTVQYVHQCLDCGHRVGGPISKQKALAGPAPLPWDGELERSKEREIRDALDRNRIVQQTLMLADHPAFSELYRQHVTDRSPKWQELCRLVFDRAKGMCEACGLRSAVHVHHRSYEHLGDEFLWELAAVCRECHRRIHPTRFGQNGKDEDFYATGEL